MESVKKRLINFCKGFVIWLLLLFFNTRSGEADANGFKIILDVILAIILVGEYKLGRYIALLTAALTVVLTLLTIPAGLEIFLLIGISILSGILLKIMSEDIPTTQFGEAVTLEHRTTKDAQWLWKSQNFFNPFEKYFYSPDTGISICKGIIRRSYIPIPTITVKVRIDQNIWQRILGFSNVSFQNVYTGQQFSECCLKNIRFCSAMELKELIH